MSYLQRRRFLWVLFLLGMALIAIAASGTTLARLSFRQLVDDSSAIARVRCLSSNTLMERGEIWTDTTFEVVRRDKGLPASPMVVRMPGGKFEHLNSHVDGTPGFRAGEEAYLFLTSVPGRPFYIVGWSQGTFRIRRNPLTGLETVTQDSANMAVFDAETKTFTRTGVNELRIDLFVEKLRSEIHRQSF
jgi:hypothetical protein